MKKYNKVAVGGTFDELHRGHEALIIKAFQVGKKVVIGLSTDEFVSKMNKAHKTASYAERLNELQTYLEKAGLAKRAEIVPLHDPYGLTISGKGLDGLIVSKETEVIADKINEIRCKEGLSPLRIVAVDMVQAENCVPISTTRIRKGEIDRNGHMMKISSQ
jgi:pantetheine-phosphate adenylyltransferase